jgi:hypothetical protein
MRRISAFDAFLAGAMCFVAGLLLGVALTAEGWPLPIVGLAVFGVAALAAGIWGVGSLYRSQR